ncbi:MAG: hypothetical protein L6V83_00645 [Christensenella sp.]|nr:MAG: hypothetical protein L6V83_00645 [Christensenella sp.]
MQDLQEIINLTVESLKKSLSNEDIVGKPIVNGDGTLILPVSKISVGFVGGKSDVEKTQKRKISDGYKWWRNIRNADRFSRLRCAKEVCAS